MSAYGRWFTGRGSGRPQSTSFMGLSKPAFQHGPPDFTTALATPCNLDDPTTWQYLVDPFCEPELIPGTPNISVGMEQFNDTPVVNGTAYPTHTVDPKSYG